MGRGTISRRLWVLALGFVLAFGVSASPAAAALTEFPIPSGTVVTGAITAGPDGALWFPTQKGNKSQISRLSTSGSYSEFGGLADLRPGSTGTRGITAGPDGRLWFTEFDANKIGAISTAGVVTEYSTGLSPGAGPDQITAGPDARLWFTEARMGKIGAITTSGTITEYPISSGPHDITTGPDGALWFTEDSGYLGQIGRITTQGTIFEHRLSSTESPGSIVNVGGSLSFTTRNEIGTFDIGAQAVYWSARPLHSRGIAEIAVGSDGAIWFTDSSAAFIGRKLPGGIFTNEFFLPNASPGEIVAGPDGALWFTEFGIPNRIGRITTDVPPPPTIEVRLSVSPPADPGRFSLSIDGEWRNSNAGNGDTTGKHSVGVTYHRVGWSYVGSNTSRYWSTTTCKNQGGTGETVASSTSFDTPFVPAASESDIVCTVALQRRDPPTGLAVSQNGGIVNASWTLPPGTVTGYLEFSPTPNTDGFFTDPEKIAYLFDSSDETFDSTPVAFPPGTYYVHVSAHLTGCDSYRGSCSDEFSRPPVSVFVPGPPPPATGTQAAPTGSGAAGADRVTAFSSLLVRARQKLAKLNVQAAMSERGTISVRGNVKVARSSRAYKLGLVTAPAVPGTSVKLRLKLSRKARNAVRRALKRHKKVSAKITITATDLAGNAKQEQRTVALRP
jgi:streptogramin lyase